MKRYNANLHGDNCVGSFCLYSDEEVQNAQLLEDSKMTSEKFCLWLSDLLRSTDRLSIEDEQRVRARLNQL